MKVVVYYTKMARSYGHGHRHVEVTNQKLEDHQIVASFRERGERHGWKQLQAAIAEAQKRKLTLVISHLGRLSQNLAVLKLLEGVNFIALDKKLVVTPSLIAAMQAKETERIDRWRKTIHDNGTPLGFARPDHPKLRDPRKASRAAGVKRSQDVQTLYTGIAVKLREWKKEFPKASLALLAEKLNAQGYRSYAGTPFHAVAVHRILHHYCPR